MRFFHHIFSLKNGLAVLLAGWVCLSAFGQDYIVETETGKVSVFIKQIERGKPLFELTMINTSSEFVGFSFQSDGMSAYSICAKDGTVIDSSPPVICFGGGYSHSLPPQNYRKWKSEIPQYFIQNLENLETGEYTISWKVKTSVGSLIAQPTEFYFENNTK